MKKWFTAVCTAVMLTSACAGLTACGDKDVSLTMQQIYDANATATILSTYEKTGIVQINAKLGEVTTTYLDGEVYYETLKKGEIVTSACYDKAGTVGYLLEGGAYYSLLTTTDALKAKPDKAYENQVFSDKALALAEEVVSAVKKKDGVYVQTKHNAENSVKLGTAEGVTCGAGEYLQTNYVLDKDTYRVIKLERAKVSASATTQYFKIEQKVNVNVTDYAEDLAVLYAKVQAVKSGQNTRQMTVALDPNTINEKLYSAYALMGDRFTIELGERYTHFYTDAVCETEYVYAETDKNKAFIKLYTKREYIPEEYDFTMLDIIRANDTEVLLQTYNSVGVEVSYGEEYVETTYANDKLLYVGASTGAGRCYLADGSRGYKKEGEAYFAVLQEPVELKGYVEKHYDNVAFEEEWAKRELIQYAEERDGKLHITTRLSKEDLEEKAGGTYEGVTALQTEYIVDARTYRLEKYNVYYVNTDNTKDLSHTTKLIVDGTAPAEAEEMYGRLTATENVTKVVMIISPNTMDVDVFRTQRVKGDGLEVPYGANGLSLFVDVDCTVAFEDTDAERQKDELLLYAIPVSQGE